MTELKKSEDWIRVGEVGDGDWIDCTVVHKIEGDP
jgi:hypothetical protein